MLISIIIPTYEMNGRGCEFLQALLKSIDYQLCTADVEIIVTDDSEGDDIKNVCEATKMCLYPQVQYYRNQGKKGACSNFNNGLKQAKGDIIKPMFQDDQFLDDDCLQYIAGTKGAWFVCQSAHIGGRSVHIPYPNDDILELAKGCNTYGSPSAVAWKRNDMTFDENLVWLFDCDFYARMVLKYGQPELLPTQVLIREWEGSVTNTIGRGQIRVVEYDYITNKFKQLCGR